MMIQFLSLLIGFKALKKKHQKFDAFILNWILEFNTIYHRSNIRFPYYLIIKIPFLILINHKS